MTGVNPKDKNYRRYALGVERALSTFDTAQQEWADYISFLSRLLKALQAHPSDCHIVPDSQTVATRLSQCLNHQLPSGVHQKALEVYAFAFTIIGPENLARDLHLYLPGLSSVLSFAALSVRPYFLSLLEDHILHIDPSALRPAIKSIILTLLPGLEDETSEDFERVVQVLDKFRTVSEEQLNDTQESEDGDTRDSYFWQCFFLATITSPSRRQGALAFLVRYLPKFATFGSADKALQSLPRASQAALSPEPGLLIRCFAAGLLDQQLLVQRGFLDLLVTHLPLDSAVLQQAVPKADLDRIVFAAAGVVSRRDMSLNRRLWAWLLGPDPKADLEKSNDNAPLGVKSPTTDLSSHHAAYFERYGLQSLTRGILSLLHRKEVSSAERARPFRISLSLMDRWEVGGLLIPDIFIPAVKNVFEYSQSASKNDVDDVVKSASIFFDGVESGLIWAKIFELLETSLKPSTQSELSRTSNLQLCLFIIQRFSLREEEMLVHHMPLTTLAAVVLLNERDARPKSKYHSTQVEHLALDIVERIANMIPERAFMANHSKTNAGGSPSRRKEILNSIRRFYTEHHGTLDGTSPPLSPAVVGQNLLRQTITLFLSSLGPSTMSGSIETTTRIICILVQKVPGVTTMLREVDLQSSLQDTLAINAPEQTRRIEFPTVSAMTMLLSATQFITTEDRYMNTTELLQIQHALVHLLWNHLIPGSPKYHVEAVRCLWQLEANSPSSRYVEAAITDLLSSSLRPTGMNHGVSGTDGARRFAVLWTHSMQEKSAQGGEKAQRGMMRRTSSSTGLNTVAGFPTDPSAILARPLFVLLDCLAEEGTELFDYVKAWIQQLSMLPRMFDIIIAEIRSLRCFKIPAIPANINSSRKDKPSVITSDDSEHCLYYMRMLLRIIKHASEHTWLVVAGDMVDPLSPQGDQEPEQVALQSLLIEICMKALQIASSPQSSTGPHLGDLERTSLEILLLLVQGPFSAPLKELELEKPLLDRLQTGLSTMEPLLQTSLLSTITATLKLRFHSAPYPKTLHQRRFSRDITPSLSRTSISEKPASLGVSATNSLSPPPSLIECLKAGFSLPSSRIVLESWVAFLVEVLPLFSESIFQNLMPLVECFCTQMGLVFEQLKSTFLQKQTDVSFTHSPEPTLISLMNGLEQILARAHDRLVTEELKASSTKSPDQPQGFFGNMVQGVFASETEKPTRTSTANNRLAVLLCFQDTVRSCFTIWSWGLYGHGNEKQDAGSIASFGYTSLRMRNRARRLLEHLFSAEALESLETLAVFFCRPPSADFQKSSVMGLLNVLNGSRPRHTIPAIFNAIYSRTNPTALDPGKMSSLTSELGDTELVGFLVEYTKSIEDDAMDEIWADCMAFVKDVLANPLLHSQILPLLLDFVTLIAEKVDNTNFGEQRKMRKELGDVFLRMLTATFTTRPMGFLQDPTQPVTNKDRSVANGTSNKSASPKDFVSILASVVPRLQLILADNERIGTAAASISTSVIGPTIRAKAFPTNLDDAFLDLLYQLTKLPQGSKAWKKDVTDALNDSRFFTMPVDLVESRWTQILRQLAIIDKDRMPDLLSRITAPTTAGIVFGVGATSARMEADRKTQLNLRRIALLILSSDEDTFVPNIRGLEEKIVELLTATPTSSPSSATRSDIFMVLRALILKTSSVHLAPLWPIINLELHATILSIIPTNRDGGKEDKEKEKYDIESVIQACKVLDTLVTLNPDDFQLHEWLFITDTIDAVYRPSSVGPTSLSDEVAEALGSVSINTHSVSTHTSQTGTSGENGTRTMCLEPMLKSLEEEGTTLSELPRQVIAARVLRPFFGQLSMLAFEGVYGMGNVDRQDCEGSLLKDLFGGEG
ncbi:cellular morphogenesis regulator dopa [Venturia nashicola]|nr:cellular morphogenesis regulator dopa [Venturia nashicola]